jgi:hypothetical protein
MRVEAFDSRFGPAYNGRVLICAMQGKCRLHLRGANQGIAGHTTLDQVSVYVFMNTVNLAVVLFRSTQGAIRAERTLTRAGLVATLIPTPRRFSSDCGTALRCRWVDVDQILAVLRAARVDYATVHRMTVRAPVDDPQAASGEGGDQRG